MAAGRRRTLVGKSLRGRLGACRVLIGEDGGMRSPITDYLTEALDACAGDDTGAVADYIPELATADPDRFAACLVTADGTAYPAGDAEYAFTVQSISKPFVYGMVL